MLFNIIVELVDLSFMIHSHYRSTVATVEWAFGSEYIDGFSCRAIVEDLIILILEFQTTALSGKF